MPYFGILDGADDVWGVRIPDLPGCHGGGATPDAAISDALSAAVDWLSLYGKAPNARAESDIAKLMETGEALVLISVDSGLLADVEQPAER